MSRFPPIPPQNRSDKGPGEPDHAGRDASKRPAGEDGHKGSHVSGVAERDNHHIRSPETKGGGSRPAGQRG